MGLDLENASTTWRKVALCWKKKTLVPKSKLGGNGCRSCACVRFRVLARALCTKLSVQPYLLVLGSWNVLVTQWHPPQPKHARMPYCCLTNDVAQCMQRNLRMASQIQCKTLACFSKKLVIPWTCWCDSWVKFILWGYWIGPQGKSGVIDTWLVVKYHSSHQNMMELCFEDSIELSSLSFHTNSQLLWTSSDKEYHVCKEEIGITTFPHQDRRCV